MEKDIVDKLKLGQERLASADAPDGLGAALISLHGALEDHVRSWLSHSPHVPLEQRALVANHRYVQWGDLLELLQQHSNLSQRDRRMIARANAMRQQFAHGKPFKGSRNELEAYAKLVQSIVQGDYLKYNEPAPPQSAERKRTKSAPNAPHDPDSVSAYGIASAPALPYKRSLGCMPVLLATVLVVIGLFAAWRGGVWQSLGPSLDTFMPDLEQGVQQATPFAALPTVTAVPTPISAPTAQRMATVAGLSGSTLRVRTAPSLDAEPLDYALSEGATVAIIGGPVEADGYTWWQIMSDGRSGWCAGEFLTFDNA